MGEPFIPYEFARDPEILRSIQEESKPAPRFSPKIIAKERGQPLPETSKDRVFLSINHHSDGKKKKAKAPKAPKAVKSPTIETPMAKDNTVLEHGIGTIQSTNQYHLFKRLDANRKVDKRHLNNLVKEIKKKNMLHLRPITVDADMNIIDGQHRLAAAKQLKVPIYYTKDDQVKEEDIAGLNTHQKNWGVDDYLSFYATKGVENYKTFLAFAAQFPDLKSTMLLPIVSTTGTRNASSLRAGTLDIGNIDKAKVILEQLEDLKKYSELVQTSRFMEAFAFIAMHESYDHERMVAKIGGNPAAIVPAPNKKAYILQLQNIFNKHVHDRNIVMFIKRL